MNTVEMGINYQNPENAEIFLTRWRTINFSRSTLLHGVNY